MRRPRPSRPLLIPILTFLALVAAVAWPVYCQLERQKQSEPRGVAPRGELSEDERHTIQIFQEASPSVVYITSVALRRDFFSLRVDEIPRGSGTGFLWDRQGHVVTNDHVVQGGRRWIVTLSDGSSWDGELVGAEPDKDLAVLQIEAPRDALRPLPVGRSADLQVGQKVLAIGNPFGLDETLTTGIISALGREIQSLSQRLIRDVIQTDAAINPGNSGGPLLDSAGRLIGVNSAIYSPSGAYAGIGFAIPVDTVNRVVPDLIAFGRVRRPVLGINPVPDRVTAAISRRYRIRIDGVLVLDVEQGTGAWDAGIRPTQRDRQGRIILGDVITSIEDQPIRSADDLADVLEGFEIGNTVSVKLLRDGEEETLRVRLGSSL